MNRIPQLFASRCNEVFTFSLYNTSSIITAVAACAAANFFSLLLLSPLPFFRRLYCKTFSLFSSLMESMSIWDDDFSAIDAPPHSPFSLPPPPSAEPLFLVPFRWWSEVNAAVYEGREIGGVLYNTTSCLRNKRFWTDDLESEVESEIMLEMRTADQVDTAQEVGVSGSDITTDLCLALISEWMFLRAFKWHNDRKDVGGFSSDALKDLFSLQIRLTFMMKENSFSIRINQKDNKNISFQRACDIFCNESGQLQIWDFSGQTSQFLVNEQKLFSVSNQPGDDILLKLEVYGLSLVEARETKREKLMVEQFNNGVPSSNCSLMMNGSTNNVYSYSRAKETSILDVGCNTACTLGLTGLFNIGNTCFMNSTLQCLMHTAEIVDYFLGDFHKDLNYENPLGMNGNIARAFGELLRKLWTPGATSVAPNEFKSVITGFAPQFSGYNQHDSQELLSYLLDGLHEDLNRVKSKPYLEVKDEEGRPHEEIADEHWRNYIARNDSVVVDLFQGQYRSRVVCPVCEKMSITFDPFMYLSLPLPSTTTRTMTLTVLSSDGTTLPSPTTITVPEHGNLKDFVEALSMACSLKDDETLLVAEVYDNSIIRILEDPSDKLELIRDSDRLVAYRLPKDSENFPLVVFTHPEQGKFGVPIVSRMSPSSERAEMRKEFLRLLHPFLIPIEDSLNDYDDACNTVDKDLEAENTILDQEHLPFLIPIEDSQNDCDDDACTTVDKDLGAENTIFDQEHLHTELETVSTNMPKDYEIHMGEPIQMTNFCNVVNVLVSWPENMLKDYNTSLLNSLPEVCKPSFLLKKPQESVALYSCLDAFLKEEPLGPDDMWYCPSCKSHQQASKKLDLWRLPDILVIHLKRFSYSQYFKSKLENFVDFPIDDFDLSNYMDHKESSISHQYSLYAISNHFGSLFYGHYTTFIKYRGRWYDFNDNIVNEECEEDIKTSSAYVLFYRRIKG